MKRTFLQRVGPIRVRTTAAAVLVVGATLLVAAIAMVVLFERSLTRGSLVSARIQALAVVRELRSDDVRPADLILGAPEEDEQFVQILRQDGTVVAASPNVTGREAVVRLGDGESLSLPPLSPPDIEPFDDPFIVTALVMRDQGLKVLVGKNLEPVQVASAHLQGILARAMPLQLLVVGIVTWLVVGRALQPVEAIRADVDAISARDLHRRVPDPPGDDEISRLVATMNRMLERLEDARLRERRFVSDASHELRSPVAAIRQYAEVARVHPDRTSLEELAEVVLEEDARLQHLVEDLLFLTRLDEGTLVRPSTPVDLDDLVLEEASRLRTATHLRVDSTGVSPGRVVGDRDQLERLVRNLTENAARHATGQVRVSLGELDGRVVLRVDDDGSGVDPRHRERIFDRFVRLDEARDRDSGGSGLGLAIVREVAEFHGGDVRVLESDLGGSRFEIRLPATA